jgi:hypothetical protein
MKTLVFIVYDAFGDWVSCNGMIRYLSKEYDEVLLLLDTDGCLSFISDLFKDNEKIKPITQSRYFNMCLSEFPFDIIDVRVNEIYPFPNNNGKYYNVMNKYGDEVYETSTDNASNFYVNMGISSEIRLKEFYYERNYGREDELFDSLHLPRDYSIVCEMGENLIDRKYITETNIVNIHRLADPFTHLLKVVENAREIHLIENSISLFIYHMQFIGKMNPVTINLHSYARKESHRKCDGPNCNNKFLNMLKYPKLHNWNFI